MTQPPNYYPPYYAPGPFDAPDPLVPRTFNEWTTNIIAVLRRCGAQVLAMMAVWSVIPVIVSTSIQSMMDGPIGRLNSLTAQAPRDGYSNDQLNVLAADSLDLLGISAVSIAVGVVVAYLSAAGWAAVMRLVTADAAGAPVTFGDAFRYGARRGLAIWGWYILAYVCVLVGACLCVLPGLYLAVTFALFAPVALYEGGPAIARSLRLVHKSFGPMLGRIALLCAVVMGIGLVFGVGESVSSVIPGNTVFVYIVRGIFSYLGEIATMSVLCVGLLVTYAEARFREGTLTNASQLSETPPAA